MDLKQQEGYKVKYSVVIVTYNQKKALKRALDSILKQTIKPSEFIIIDNNSQDGTADFLLEYKRKYTNFKVFHSEENLGTCRGINLGVHLAEESIILNVDHDSELMNENWVELALEKLNKNRIALVWGTSNKGNSPKFTYANFIGSAILFKKDIYLNVGGFPDDFFIYDNELDLTVRYYIAGYYPYFYPKLDVKHGLPSEEFQAISVKKGKSYIYYDLSNRLFIYWKYYPFYFALILSVVHFIQVMTSYTKYFKEYFEPFNGLRRFFSKFYVNVCRQQKLLPLNRFLKICYHQQYPTPVYWLLKKIYG
jgi:GT2 family glycosyltransferase